MCAGLYLYLSQLRDNFAWFFIVPGLILRSRSRLCFPLVASTDLSIAAKTKSEYQLRFDNDAIRFKTDTIDSTLQWSTYHSWLRDNEFYILYHGSKEMTVIQYAPWTLTQTGNLPSCSVRKLGHQKPDRKPIDRQICEPKRRSRVPMQGRTKGSSCHLQRMV